ncbi:MAG: hypothetical protein ACTH5K_02480 [Pseudolactococcus laudensis]
MEKMVERKIVYLIELVLIILGLLCIAVVIKNNKEALNRKVFSNDDESVTGKYQMGATVALIQDTMLSVSLGYSHGDKAESLVNACV